MPGIGGGDYAFLPFLLCPTSPNYRFLPFGMRIFAPKFGGFKEKSYLCSAKSTMAISSRG